MSRDFTPRELYAVEQHIYKPKGLTLLEIMKSTLFTYNGETSPLYSEESISNREKFPLLGSLFNKYDSLYSFLSQVEGGMDLLARHEKELDAYIKTGQGDKDSALIQWFEGTLDKHFYYSETNDELFLACMKDEIGNLYRFDPKLENCFWFPLSDDKCISVWFAPDKYDGDQLLMKLEQRAEDGAMGPFCEVLIDESYATANLSEKAICRTLKEIYEDAGLQSIAESASIELADKVMSVFALKKMDLEEQIRSAKTRTPQTHDSPDEKIFSPER